VEAALAALISDDADEATAHEGSTPLEQISVLAGP
jgi:hypothetical protein